ncbi:hypothetical protein B0H19DRAFT_1254924 [Mycena capillaripes]|nr:hypothetical protein B0H19DRAFT_1254924 [Mycena capillaripes]
MAYFNAEAEPFEEASRLSENGFFPSILIYFQQIQGNRAPKASQDELKAFYKEMERGDLERKLSKRKSSSMWSRKSLRRTSTSQSQQSQEQAAPAPTKLTSPSTSSLARPPPLRTINDHERGESADTVPPMPAPLSRSIIPDRLNELPSWYRDNTNHAVRYPMHNPVGPRWYKNHHLIPPANARPLGGPPSVFSPSFPPMASSGNRSEPSLSRSASNSPLPTPNSSQTRMEEVPRSRKTSQTAHDNVDLLDVTDPWGTPWHHESPYDVGLSSSPALEETPHTAPQNSHNPHTVPRSRTSSMNTAQNRRKTVTPSPLSQSTSAVHLQVPEGSGNQLPRKLSKRRTVGLFGRQATSAPVSPVNEPDSRGPSPQLGPPSSFIAVTSKKERRGSVLGRFAKRFSLTRKPAPVAPMEFIRQPSPEKLQPSPGKYSPPDQLKRVPPPLVHQESSFVVIPPPQPQPDPPKVETDRASTVSVEAEVPYTMGRLTVANPDPGSVESTPVQRELSLPPERAVEHELGATCETISAGHQRAQSPESFVRASRSPEPVASSSRLSIRSQQHSSQNVVEPQATARSVSPPPPPAPEKPSDRASNGHRRPSSGSRTPVERSTSPPSNRPPSGLGRAQSPPTGNRLLEKPQPPPPSPPSPKLPAVPFPDNSGLTPAPLYSELPYQLPEMTADISPLSTTSMLVNPPTPYTKEMLMPDEPEPAPPPVPSKRSSRDPSPSRISVTARETETFRLVRSSSGNVYASSETIRAAGEQWEVMESKSKGKNRSQDRESESRKEQRRQARAEKEAESEQPKVRSERKRRSADDSGDRHRPRLPIPDALVSPPDDPSPTRGNRPKRDEERERKADHKTADLKLDKPQPPPPLPSRSLERNPSKSARPISEVPTAADMNMMKAREAWDMDRLWKARSMSGMEANGVAAPPIPAAPMPASHVPNGQNAQDPPAIYGSSHTAFMVSTPFQQPPSSQIYHSMPNVAQPSSSPPIYHSMPNAPPPPLAYPAGYTSPSGYSNTSNRASPSEHSSNGISPRPPLANPLPEPPRESSYEPAPLNLPEYWGKHASVTTAH